MQWSLVIQIIIQNFIFEEWKNSFPHFILQKGHQFNWKKNRKNGNHNLQNGGILFQSWLSIKLSLEDITLKFTVCGEELISLDWLVSKICWNRSVFYTEMVRLHSCLAQVVRLFLQDHVYQGLSFSTAQRLRRMIRYRSTFSYRCLSCVSTYMYFFHAIYRLLPSRDISQKSDNELI